MFPSMKFDQGSGCFRPSSDIWVTVCAHCGLVYETPQVVLEQSSEYQEKHYYNAFNQIAMHDATQRIFNPHRWSILKDRVRWGDARRVIDVGASGAWSAWVKTKFPDVESIVLEPSAEAIEYCRQNYPDVVPVHGIFESYDPPAGSLDVISFHFSLYTITNPLDALVKCRRLLTPQGYLLVAISHVLCEVEVWSEEHRRPWLDLDHVIRGVPLVYYSRRTLAALLDAAGFDVEDAFQADYEPGSPLEGRGDHWVVARPRAEGAAVPVAENPVEVAWAERFLTKYCELASRRSIEVFLSERSGDASGITVVFDDDGYRDWVCRLLASSGRTVTPVPLGAYQANGAPGDTIVLNATMTPLGGRAIDCLRPDDGNGYGYFARGWEGQPVPARAFLPERRPGIGLFPFGEA